MSILSVDNISPIGSGTSVTVNSAATLVLTNANSTGVVTATSFVGSGANLTGVLSNIVEDTSPQLGGNLDTNSHEISLDTSHAINFGDSNELRVFYHSGNGQIDFNGTTSLQLKTPANKYFQVVNRDNGNNIIQAQAGGVVQLYHNGAKKFDTTTTGVRVHGDEGGTAQLQLLADQGDDNPDYWRFIAETNGILNIQDYGSGSWYNNIRLTGHTGGVMLFQDNDAKFQTQSDGVRVEDGGHLYFANDSENASSSIRNVGGSGVSNLIFTTGGVDRWQILNGGHLVPQANNAYDIGMASYRVRNIYTMDLHCSNKGSKNDVDGTWGDYTIQEGESDLFLINNRSGKKYKFNLTEVK